MVQVRKNVFETNSSSTHSLVIAVKSEFDKWERGEVLYCNYFWSKDKNPRFIEGKLYPVEEVEKYYEETGDERDPYDFCTYDEFIDTDYLEVETYSYTTPKGEVIKAVAKFGYDG